MRILRWFWGILTLLSCGFIIWAFAIAGNVLSEGATEIEQQYTSEDQQNAALAGATIGTGIGLTMYLACGVPVFLLSAFLYWRNGVGMAKKKENETTERRHQEQLAMMQAQIDTKNKNS